MRVFIVSVIFLVSAFARANAGFNLVQMTGQSTDSKAKVQRGSLFSSSEGLVLVLCGRTRMEGCNRTIVMPTKMDSLNLPASDTEYSLTPTVSLIKKSLYEKKTFEFQLKISIDELVDIKVGEAYQYITLTPIVDFEVKN